MIEEGILVMFQWILTTSTDCAVIASSNTTSEAFHFIINFWIHHNNNNVIIITIGYYIGNTNIYKLVVAISSKYFLFLLQHQTSSPHAIIISFI